ncbi:IS4 family transposase [Evansella tamaricis]|uniref:IS4 family transposase n=1 Tax=Evansella tamaricis TaxID=2069301 RepID=A0ABS6JG10_9BACI|nr:IS4 family transposase [Evansella tamaricis]MBU9712541.1 IS4 family transposase [Evansella tamaricis]
MNRSILSQKNVLSQCLDYLPTEDLACPILNYNNSKLTIEALVKIFVTAQIQKWESYSVFDIELRAKKELMKCIDVESISSSQLSRRINELDTAILQKLFLKVVAQLNFHTRSMVGLPPYIGRLRIVDATRLGLPAFLSSWANVSKENTAVKMHTRLIVASPDVHYPDKIVPSNGKVQDHEGGDILIEVSDETYVMDRGYMDFYRMNEWIKKDIKCVIRLRDPFKIKVLEEYEVPTGSNIKRDAKVILGAGAKMEPIRLVEFEDEKGRLYRLATTRWDLEAQYISEVYKNRWIIELFFKWIKQSLRFVKIWSTKPQGIWNQMFIAMITYLITLIVKLNTKSDKTMLDILKHIRAYICNSWKQFTAALAYKPKKTSKGRQKIPEKPKKDVVYGSVALIVDKRKKRIKKKIK